MGNGPGAELPERRPPLRIGFFIQHYPPRLGGAERQARALANLLVSRGHRVEVITTRYRRDLAAVAIENGLRVRRISTVSPRWMKLPINLLTGFYHGLKVAPAVDLIHGHCLSPFCLGALLAARLRGKPVALKICSVGGAGDIARIKGFGPGSLLWRLFRLGQLYLAPTAEVAAELAREGIVERRIAVVPNFLEQDAHAPPPRGQTTARAQLGLPDKPTILFVGRLHPGKGLASLRAAWQSLAARHDAQLLVVGEGPQWEAMVDWRAQLERPEAVHLPGYQPDPAPYYAASDILAFPSHSESFGNVLIEAMSHGLAVVTTDVGVVREFPDDFPAVKVPVGRPDLLAGALARLLADPILQKRCGRAGAEFVAARYSAAAVGAQYEALYTQLLAAG